MRVSREGGRTWWYTWRWLSHCRLLRKRTPCPVSSWTEQTLLLSNPYPCSRCPLFFLFHSHGSSHGCFPRSLNDSPSISFTHSPPPTHCTPGEPPTSTAFAVTLSLSFCFCLSACLPASLSLSLFPSIVFLSLSCSKAAAPHSGLRGYDKERPQIHARAHSCTPTQTDISHIVTALSGFSKPLLKKSDCFSTLNSSYLVPHNCWIICLSNKKNKKSAPKKQKQKKNPHSLADWHTIQTQKGKAKLWLLKQLEVKQVAVYYIEQRSPDSISNTIILK